MRRSSAARALACQWTLAAVVLSARLAGMPAPRPIPSGSGHQKRNEDPKSQVTPLPRQLPMALRADTNSLDFHLSPLLKSDGLEAQIRQSLNQLIKDTRGETIIKLRAFVAGAGDARRVGAEATQIFTDHKLPLPVLAVMQVGALGEEAAKVVIEAVVSTHRTVNGNGLAFFSGQSGTSLPLAFDRLRSAMSAAAVSNGNTLSVTCFTSRIENHEQSRREAQSAFPKATVNLVQAVRDPQSDESTCESVAQISRPSTDGPLVLIRDSRAALVTAPQLVFTGLQLSFGSFLDDAHEAFFRLERAASSTAAVQSPVEVNVFSVEASGGSALRKMTAVPPSTFTVQTIEGLPAVDASAGLEAILAPDVGSPVLR